MTQPTDPETAPLHLQQGTKAHHTLPAQADACDPLDMPSDVLKFYPDAQLALRLWNVYVKSVDPVLKILHVPTVQTTVVETILDPRSAQSSTVALTFAIYYAAVTALLHDDKNNEPVRLPCDGPTLLKRYKGCLDRLLTVNDLLIRPEMTSLQALAIYVTCLRAHEVGRRVWVLNGLAIRLAKSIDLHLDGACFHLSPFETEMRLRLWWHLCVLESRASEDQGFQPTVDIMNPKLRLPLNVNDDQICPDMTHLPTESDGWTDMSFFLIQTESCRLLHPILDPRDQQPADALLGITEKRKMIQQRSQYLSAKYAGAKSPLSRIADQHRVAARKKMEFVLQLQEEISLRQDQGPQGDRTPDVLRSSFKLACEGLESNYALLKEDVASRFKWFFNLYTPWYALTYVLRCLGGNPRGVNTERAWTLVDELFPRAMSLHGHSAGIQDEYGHGRIWRRLNLIRRQALSHRPHVQLGVAAAAKVETQPASRGEQRPSQLRPDTEVPPSTSTTAIPHGTSTFPEFQGQEFMADPNQILFTSLDLPMPEISFLPDWDAVLYGPLNDDGYEMINRSGFVTHPADTSQF
ncbi:Fungal specific transcription factor domain-containing protein isoform 2 [Cladophialophora immunda]|nr:Fungal specific transcription factor domain-containing protein isoform 1 [Cladophialophora immunda]OQU97893.1 Fungal specific transcription factor domain-containing protein isoform 2 [Cladophialophora immunda]